jgi:hypothetical protein
MKTRSLPRLRRRSNDVNAAAVIRRLWDPRYRGWLLDAVALLSSLILFYLLGRISRTFVLQAEHDATAKLLIGIFFVALLLLQPWGPLLKRRPFHARHPGFGSSGNDLAGCWVVVIALAYLVMMLIVGGAASSMISETIFAGSSGGESIGVLGVLLGLAWSVFTVVLWVRFFFSPKKPTRIAFLNSPRADGLADLSIFLNVIFLQILWGNVMASSIFWEVVLNTPLGKPNSITAIAGRFIVIAVVALMVYFPARIFSLVEQKQRRWAWLTMVVANLPIILKALLSQGK